MILAQHITQFYLLVGSLLFFSLSKFTWVLMIMDLVYFQLFCASIFRVLVRYCKQIKNCQHELMQWQDVFPQVNTLATCRAHTIAGQPELKAVLREDMVTITEHYCLSWNVHADLTQKNMCKMLFFKCQWAHKCHLQKDYLALLVSLHGIASLNSHYQQNLMVRSH